MRSRVTVLGVCLCVCYCASSNIPGLYVQSEVIYSSGRLLKIYIVWTLLKMFRSGDMALFACDNDQRFSSFSTKNTPMVLDMIINGTVYQPLARNDDYLK